MATAEGEGYLLMVEMAEEPRKSELYTAKQILYANCPICDEWLAWRHYLNVNAMYATCHDLLFRAEPIDGRRNIFYIDVYPTRSEKVISFPIKKGGQPTPPPRGAA